MLRKLGCGALKVVLIGSIAGVVSLQACADNIENATAQPKKGDQWTYDYTDLTTNTPAATTTYTVTEVANSEVTVSVSKLGAPGSWLLVFDKDWNVKQDNLWKNLPGDGLGFQLPLKVGQAWPISGSNKNVQNGAVFRHQGKSRVVDETKIQTSAGEFDAFKIVSDLKWFAINGGGLKSDIHAETWFAPEINRIVKRTYTSHLAGHVASSYTMELTDNSPN